MTLALLLTGARGAWLSAAAVAAFYLWLTGRVRLRAWQWIALLLSISAFLAVFEIRYAKTESDAMRVELLKSAGPIFESHPLLGWGPDNFLNAFRAHKTDGFLRVTKLSLRAHPNAHDDVLQVAATLGGLGLLAYAWLLWALGCRLKRLLSEPRNGGIPAGTAAIAAGLGGLSCRPR